MILTQKQENFCLAYIETGNASEAYRRSYSCGKMKTETINRKAFDLFQNGNVTARIDELRKEAVKRNEITVDDLIAELEEARQAALCADDPKAAAAVAATMGKAKLLGLGAEKLELTGKNGGPVEMVAPKLEIVLHKA